MAISLSKSCTVWWDVIEPGRPGDCGESGCCVFIVVQPVLQLHCVLCTLGFSDNLVCVRGVH